jgi:hypothetical protein
MLVMYFTHGLFLTCTQNLVLFTNHIFNLHTKSRFIYKSSQYLQNVQQFSSQPTPCISNKQPCLLTWRDSFFARGDESYPPLSLVCQQLSHPLAFTPLTLSHPTVQITLFT